jgi:hypothetical protein
MAFMEWGPGLPEMTRLSRIHVLNFFRDGGIWVKWKQYMTSDTWSAPVLLIPERDIPNVARWRPEQRHQSFKKPSTKLAWLNKFEVSLADATWSLDKHADALAHLRDIVNSMAPMYQAGPNVEEILVDLMKLGGQGREAAAATTSSDHAYPADLIVQLFPGAYLNRLLTSNPESLTLLIKSLTLNRSRIAYQPSIMLLDAIPYRLPNCQNTTLWIDPMSVWFPDFVLLSLVSGAPCPERF